MVRVRRRAGAIGALVALFVAAGAVYAATSSLTAPSSVGGSQQVVTSPCSSTDVTMTPTYSASDGAYVITTVVLDLVCPAGSYRVTVALATGAATYVEKGNSFTSTGSITTTVLTLPSRVKVSDLTNVAVLVVPL